MRTNPPANLPVGGLHKLVKEVESGDLVYEMKPFKIDFQLLKQARQTAFNVVSTPIEGKKKNWTKSQCQAYLAYHCLNRKIQDECYDLASIAFESNVVLAIGSNSYLVNSKNDPLSKEIISDTINEYRNNQLNLYLT